MIVADGYSFNNGAYTVPDAPGMGIGIDEKKYKEKYKAQETVVT